MSASESIATPVRPTSPTGARVVGVVPELRRQVERDREPGLAALEQVAEARVRLLGRGEARVLADRPRPAAVHVLVGPARERELARQLELELRDVLVRVDRLDLDSGVGLAAILGGRHGLNRTNRVARVTLRLVSSCPLRRGDERFGRPQDAYGVCRARGDTAMQGSGASRVETFATRWGRRRSWDGRLATLSVRRRLEPDEFAPVREDPFRRVDDAAVPAPYRRPRAPRNEIGRRLRGRDGQIRRLRPCRTWIASGVAPWAREPPRRSPVRLVTRPRQRDLTCATRASFA